jgi:thiamine biosynthesis lipoprotein ApbE
MLDACTSKSIEHDIVSVTELDDNSTMAYAWSTALLYPGRQASRRVVDRAGISVLFIPHRNGQLEVSASTVWRSQKKVEVQ